MAIKKNRTGAAFVTLIAGVVSGNWQDPDTFLGTAPVQNALEYPPAYVWCQRVDPGTGGQGVVRVTAITVDGFTLTSSDLTDNGQFRVYAVCRKEDI